MERPATTTELRAFVDREQAGIRADRGLPPAAARADAARRAE
jgi:hypothetical protein